ncbi:MAG: radical SAM protein [Myxococcota bacterium]
MLLIDLNNFARYPTLAVGLLAAILRDAGISVAVLSPLALGVSGPPREPRTLLWGEAEARLRYATAMSRKPLVTRARAALVARRNPLARNALRKLLAALDAKLARGCDAVLISTYLMYFDACREIASACAARGVPVLIGGSYFAQAEVANEWTRIPGVNGVVVGEVEPQVAEIVRALIDGEALEAFPGVCVPGGRVAGARPLLGLDALPFPDYGDFPWDRYPNRIVPMLTGRGCGWGVCTFCSDVTSTAGRSFRSRSPENVLDELELQARRHATELFAFTDLKLNSDAAVWTALLSRLRARVPSARWIGAVHVTGNRPDGVSLAELRAAKAAGMVRLTTGLESGSQRVLDLMRKGTELGTTRRFLDDAVSAGLSVRLTMIVGYPGERAADVARSASFVEEYAGKVERIMLNRFALVTGTRVHRDLERDHEAFPDLDSVRANHRMAVLDHAFAPADERGYRKQIYRLLAAVHGVNRRPIRESASPFDGVM